MTMEIITFLGGYDNNFSYMVLHGNEAVIIDPFEDISLYQSESKKHDSTIIGFLNTHEHFDHTKGNTALLKKKIPNLSENPPFGIQVLETPGHSPKGKCFLLQNHVFTGDTLFVECIGRVEDEDCMRESLRKLSILPDDTIILPGHHYGSTPTSTIAEEKKKNQYFKMFLYSS